MTKQPDFNYEKIKIRSKGMQQNTIDNDTIEIPRETFEKLASDNKSRNMANVLGGFFASANVLLCGGYHSITENETALYIGGASLVFMAVSDINRRLTKHGPLYHDFVSANVEPTPRGFLKHLAINTAITASLFTATYAVGDLIRDNVLTPTEPEHSKLINER
ncbi:MAG: hypothetical protein ACPGRX_08345 [Bdellovibrionales bacterium]